MSPRSLEDLDAARSKAFSKGGGNAAPLTMAEQILREKGERALAVLEKAKASGDPVAIAQARVPAERVQAALQRVNAARGSLAPMRQALSRSMTDVTVR